jgi:DNA-binding CsgD family transcriptional regulator
LSERQREVLALIAKGHTNSEIAEQLGISLDGVKWHVREILSRLGVESREEAAVVWRERQSVANRVRRKFGGLPSVLTMKAAVGAVALAAVVGAVILVVASQGGGPAPQSGGEPPTSPSGETLSWPRTDLAGVTRVVRDQPHPYNPVVEVLDSGKDGERQTIAALVEALKSAGPLEPDPQSSPFEAITAYHFYASGQRLLTIAPAWNCTLTEHTQVCVPAPGEFWYEVPDAARSRFHSNELEAALSSFGSTVGHEEPRP